MIERHAIRNGSCLVLTLVAPSTSGGVSAGDIQVTQAWSRPTPPGADVGVAYFVINNQGRNDRLVGASAPVAKRAGLHISGMEGGVMKMRPLDAVEVRGGVATSFQPSGRHVMLTGLKRPLKAGEVFPLVLDFANAGPVKVQVRVKGTAGMGETGHGADHSNMKRSEAR